MGLLGRIFSLISAIGAINWGLYALFQFNLVEYSCDMLGRHMWDKYVYIIIALAGIFTVVSVFRD
ncbi:DUF378 domain-containing protein [Candidatus Dependentiae bacterium]|nr:DUF378 domain-containing protein [Candidatus Dependentiae bacterium]